MKFSVERGRKVDGRWPAEVPDLLGLMAYGNTAKEAHAKPPVLL